MYKVGDYIMHKRDVCVIKEIKEKFFKGMDYYSISPALDDSLTINVPVNSPVIRDVISKEEALEIIDKIVDVDLIESDDKYFENAYKELLETDDLLDLVKIIKTTYLRNQNRLLNGKKIGDRDDSYFKKAESLLYTSLSVALGMEYEECKEYIISKVREKEEGIK